jgi:hypothetical protein
MNYILAHWSAIITALTTLIIAARLIVKLTPTPRDDTALEKIVSALKHVGLHVKDKAPLLALLLLLPACAVNSDGAKTFVGITGPGWLAVGKSAVTAAAPVAMSERAKFEAKNPKSIQP